MANKWIEHLKDFAKKHKISYSDAVSSDICRKEYYKNKEKETPKAKKVKKEPIEPMKEQTKKVKKEPIETMNELKKGMTIKKNKNPVME